MTRSRRSRCVAGQCLAVVTALVASGTLLAAPPAASAAGVRALRTYVPEGTAASGTSSPAGAPALRPGQYKDTLRAEEQRNYTINLADGVSPYFGVTLIRPPAIIDGGQASGDYVISTDTLTIAISTSAGTDCGDLDWTQSQDRLVTSLSGVARPGRVGNRWNNSYSGSSDSGCGKPGKYVVTVSRTQSSERIPNVELPIEIVFIAEPPLAEDVTKLPRPQLPSTSSLAPDITGAAKKVQGGGSYGKAAELSGSSGYSDTIRPGETLFYRVRLGWGQRLGYTVRFHGEKAIDASYSVGARLDTPFRLAIYQSDDTGTYSNTSDEKVGGQTAARVAYRNRDSDVNTVWELRLAGYYYLVVTMENGRDDRAAEIPIDIAVRVDGKAQPSPKYQHIKGTSDPDDLGLPGQGSGGSLLRKVAYLSGGGLALVLAALVLFLPFLRRRRAGA